MLVGLPRADDVNHSVGDQRRALAMLAASSQNSAPSTLLTAHGFSAACGGRCIPGLIPRNWWSRDCGQRGNLLDLVRQLFFGRVEVIGALHVDP
jgi:hypothetical protein